MSTTEAMIEDQINKDEGSLPLGLASAQAKRKAERENDAAAQREIALRIRAQKQASRKLRALRGAIKEEIKRQSDNIVNQNEQKLMIAFAQGFGILVGIEILVPDEAIAAEEQKPMIEVVSS